MKKYLIVFKEKPTEYELLKYDMHNIQTFSNLDTIITCMMTTDNASELYLDTNVLSVEIDGNDNWSAPDKSYAFNMMEVQKFHDIGITGKGVKVAILDTGVQRHVDLKLKGGYNAFDATLPYDANLASNHGTFVAGIIGMQSAGIAPDVELYAVRIDNGNGQINRTDWSSQIRAIDWCIENEMDAINCSFSSDTDSIARKLAFERAYEAGIAIFCSAGNLQTADNTEPTTGYPSKYSFVNTVANILADKSRYVTSSVGKGINFSSGGTSVTSTNTDSTKAISDSYRTGTGTSYATPAVMGMYALYKEYYQEDRDKILERMFMNTEKLGGLNEFGAGLPKFPAYHYDNIQIKGS